MIKWNSDIYAAPVNVSLLLFWKGLPYIGGRQSFGERTAWFLYDAPDFQGYVWDTPGMDRDSLPSHWVEINDPEVV